MLDPFPQTAEEYLRVGVETLATADVAPRVMTMGAAETNFVQQFRQFAMSGQDVQLEQDNASNK